MKRPLLILVGAVVLGAAIFAGAFLTGQRTSRLVQEQPADDLNWLRLEFHLGDAELARIRKLHEGYLPQCAATCREIADKKRELEAAGGDGTNLTAAAQLKLQELDQLRARCRAQMLRYFTTVSQAMPPEEGRRYLEKMRALTSATQTQMEQSMSGDASHERHP
jgi:hypothetical protein